MRGVDGNYIKMQGELLARLQVAYQAEQTAQQTRAQAQSLEALRQLREQVESTYRSDGGTSSRQVGPKQDGESGSHRETKSPPPRTAQPEETPDRSPASSDTRRSSGHVDLRI